MAKLLRALRLTILVLGAAAFLLPIYWLFVQSFTPLVGYLSLPPRMLPIGGTLDNYRRLFAGGVIGVWYRNSFVVSIGATLTILLLCSWMGTAFAFYEFPGKRWFFGLMVASMATPAFISLIPLFLLTDRLHLVGHLGGMVVPHLAWPFGAFLMTQFLKSTPPEIVDAARMDGASGFRFWLYIVLPISKPALGVLGVLAFVWSWKAFIWPSLIYAGPETMTLTVGVWWIVVGAEAFHDLPDIGVNMAGGVMGALPLVALFFVFQRAFVKGLLEGAIR